MNTPSPELSKKSKQLWLILLVTTIIIIAVVCVVFLCERELPQMNIVDNVARLGTKNNIRFSFADTRSGIRAIKIRLVQDKKESTLFEKTFIRQGHFSKSGPNTVDETIPFNVKELGFNDGKALILASVTDFSWWNWMAGNTSEFDFQFDVDTTPPRIEIIESPIYISVGGSGVVVYRLNEPVAENGVVINENRFQGYQLSGREPGIFAAFIGIPYQTSAINQASVVARDLSGNSAQVSFSMRLKALKNIHDSITVSENFLALKLPEFRQYYPELTGSSLDQYLYINNSIRLANNAAIEKICQNSSPEMLWEGTFEQMRNGEKKAGFADQRTYYSEKTEIDKQVHLGIDLAANAHADIKAANRGRVVFADYLGIYGNTVILDHGLGLFSLYAHLSEINAALQETVEKNAVIAKSGTTGMAGGDHLHFSMLVGGVFVTPVEWWDSSWVDLHVTGVLR